MCRLTLLVSSLLPITLGVSLSSHLSRSDRDRFSSILSTSLTSSDPASLHYAVLGLSLLGDDVASPGPVCANLGASATETNAETLFQASTAAASLGCPLTLSKEASAAVAANLAEGATTASIYFAAKTQVSVGSKLDSPTVLKSLTKAVKKDDSLLSLGLAFHTASLLEGDLTKFFDRIEDAVVQADEVDGKLLQFEGGLSVTSVVLTGAANLAIKSKKKLPVTGEQAVKFANYLMSRKSVQQAKGIFHLLEAISTMSANPQHVPLCVSLASAVSVSAAEPNVVISVSDIGGGDPGSMKVVLDTATRREDGAVVAAKQPLIHMVTTNKYTVDLMAANPPPGFYELVLSATPVKPDSRFVGNLGVVVLVKVLATIEVTDVELRMTDTENGGRGKVHELVFPSKADAVIPVDHKEHISLSFTVSDSSSHQPLSVHQAFVCFTHVVSGSEIHYVAEAAGPDTNYKFELDLNAAAADFNSKAGEYSMVVILGDAVISNPTSWAAATLAINFPESEETSGSNVYQPKPEIRHLFREPEARPATIVSNAFTLLCLSPFLVMLILWARIGANVSNLPLSVASLGFHAGLGSIFVLYTMFWLQLNMFETVKYLVVLGMVTFLCGNSLLSGIAKTKNSG